MKILKKIITTCIITSFLTTIVGGCTDEKKEINSKGRYIEEEYHVIDGITYILDIRMLDNGNIGLVGQISNNDYNQFTINETKYYESSDMGKTWKETKDKLPYKNEDKFFSYDQGRILEDGSFVFIVAEYTQEDIDNINEKLQLSENKEEDYYEYYNDLGDFKLVKIDREGNMTEVSDDKIDMNNIGILDESDNYLYLNTYDSANIIEVNLSEGKVKKIIKTEGEYIGEAAILDNRILVNNYNNVIEYDVESGNKIEENKVLSKETMSNITYSVGLDGKTLYQIGEDGVYSYAIGNKVNEELIYGSITAFGDSEYIIDKFIEIEDNQFLAVFYNSNGNKITIKHYYYDKDIDSKQDKELTVYSLYEDFYLKKNIVKYQKEHPDVYINYKIGIDVNGSDENIISVDDAIKTLNTEIMTGEGPDIICLDELPEDSYRDKGLLLDISDISESFSDKEYFTNILKGNNIDGRIYSIPTSYTIPVIFNNTDKDVTDLNELATAVSELKGNYAGDIVLPIEAEELLYYFYSTCGMSIINKDKSLNKDKLKEYLDDVKTIYESSIDSHTEETIRDHKDRLESYEKYDKNETGESFAKNKYLDNYFDYQAIEKSTEIPAFVLSTLSSYQDIIMYNELIKKYPTLKYSKWYGLDSKSINAYDKLGISSKSKEKQLAKKFIKTLLDEEYQKTNIDSMEFSINKKIIKESLQDEEILSNMIDYVDESDNEMLSSDVTPFTDDKVKDCLKLINSYDSTKEADINIIDKTIDDMACYIKGEKSIDETISIIDEKLKSYLSK